MKNVYFRMVVVLLIAMQAHSMDKPSVNIFSDDLTKLATHVKNIEKTLGGCIVSSNCENRMDKGVVNRNKFSSDISAKDPYAYTRLVKTKQMGAIRRVLGIMHIEGTLSPEVRDALQKTYKLIDAR